MGMQVRGKPLATRRDRTEVRAASGHPRGAPSCKFRANFLRLPWPPPAGIWGRRAGWSGLGFPASWPEDRRGPSGRERPRSPPRPTLPRRAGRGDAPPPGSRPPGDRFAPAAAAVTSARGGRSPPLRGAGPGIPGRRLGVAAAHVTRAGPGRPLTPGRRGAGIGSRLCRPAARRDALSSEPLTAWSSSERPAAASNAAASPSPSPSPPPSPALPPPPPVSPPPRDRLYD